MSEGVKSWDYAVHSYAKPQWDIINRIVINSNHSQINLKSGGCICRTIGALVEIKGFLLYSLI